jgi:uncharacterized protein YecE (DUF72 family)
VGCEEDVKEFLGAMDEMGDRLGPLLFQFPHFRRDAFASADAFLGRLGPFLDTLPTGRAFAVEVRNREWVGEPLLSLLRDRGIAFALIDYPGMPPIETLMRDLDVVTAAFSYVRWLGDRQGIEALTDRWDKLIVDRAADMERWVSALASILERRVEILGYFNNHYAGYAPGSIELLRETWRQRMG